MILCNYAIELAYDRRHTCILEKYTIEKHDYNILFTYTHIMICFKECQCYYRLPHQWT